MLKEMLKFTMFIYIMKHNSTNKSRSNNKKDDCISNNILRAIKIMITLSMYH